MKMSTLKYSKLLFLKGICIAAIILFFIPASLHAQGEKKFVRQGNREYEKDKYAESEISYRKASDRNKAYPDAVFNTGDALYRQKKFEDAGKEFVENSAMNEKKDKKADAFYNLGNSMLMANKLKESIEAYENSLKLKPSNQEAKFNLAYAQDLLKKQQEQQKQQQNQSGGKDQNKKDQQQKQDQNKNQNNQDQQQDKNKQQQQPPEQTISKEDAERLLNAIANDDKNVQEKVKLAEAAKAKVRADTKNW